MSKSSRIEVVELMDETQHAETGSRKEEKEGGEGRRKEAYFVFISQRSFHVVIKWRVHCADCRIIIIMLRHIIEGRAY